MNKSKFFKIKKTSLSTDIENRAKKSTNNSIISSKIKSKNSVWFNPEDLDKVRLPNIASPKVNLPNITISRVGLPNITISRVGLPNIASPKVNLPRITSAVVKLDTSLEVKLPRIKSAVFNLDINNPGPPTPKTTRNNPVLFPPDIYTPKIYNQDQHLNFMMRDFYPFFSSEIRKTNTVKFISKPLNYSRG